MYKKPRTQNMQRKQRCWWKQNCLMTRRNVRHFLPISDRMTPNSVCLWNHKEHGDSNKRWCRRQFEPSQETGVKKMINGNVPSEFISLWFVSVHGAASYIQSKTEVPEGCSKFKGPETRQVQERLVSTLEHMQVPKWDRTRCPEE